MTLTTLAIVVIATGIAVLFCTFDMMQKQEQREKEWRIRLLDRLNGLEYISERALEKYHDDRLLPTIELLVAQKVRAMPAALLSPIPEPPAPVAKQPQKAIDEVLRNDLEQQLRRSY